MRLQEQMPHWRSGSMFSVLSLTLARALREIWYYQSGDLLLIPFTSFARLVREITDDCKRGLRWERDAIHALQIMTEHILVMIFEMTYGHDYLINSRQKLAYHAKRITIMSNDMKILHDLWQTIDPSSSIGSKPKR